MQYLYISSAFSEILLDSNVSSEQLNIVDI